jgi:hypothetical protein
MFELGHVLGFHGCEREVGEAIIAGEEIRLSENAYDWLGRGAYFWENSPGRARRWATEPRHKLKDPFVLGAVIQMGNCLDLTDTACLEGVRDAYDALEEMSGIVGIPLPANEPGFVGDGDRVKRELDCLVINFTHTYRRDAGLPPYDTVRAPWPEGEPLYPGACIRKLTHIQICVCDPVKSIRGYFRPKFVEGLSLR